MGAGQVHSAPYLLVKSWILTVLGVVIDYLLTRIVHCAMDVIGFGLTTVTLIILNTTVILVVNRLRPQKINLCAIRALQV